MQLFRSWIKSEYMKNQKRGEQSNTDDMTLLKCHFKSKVMLMTELVFTVIFRKNIFSLSWNYCF